MASSLPALETHKGRAAKLDTQTTQHFQLMQLQLHDPFSDQVLTFLVFNYYFFCFFFYNGSAAHNNIYTMKPQSVTVGDIGAV